jgi:hypothetical protein
LAAESFLAAHRGQVSPILIALGANDALKVLEVCGPDATCIGTLLPSILAVVAASLDEGLGPLRAMAPDAVIVLLQYYNPIAVIDPATNSLILNLHEVSGGVADTHRAPWRTPFPRSISRRRSRPPCAC